MRPASICFLLLLSLPASLRAADVVNNLATAASVNEDLANSSVASGHCFVTGSQDVLLTSASAYLQRAAGNAQAQFSIRANNPALNRPGAVLETLGTTPVFTDTGVKTVAASGQTLLAANTRYWLVVKNVAGSFNWYITVSTANSGSGAILDVESRSLDGGATWQEANVPDDYHQFRVEGSVPEYDYGDAPDDSNGTGPGNYQTRLADNGPRHLIRGCYFGTPPDSEADGQPTPLADGDDLNGTNDEEYFDGIGFFDRNMLRGATMGMELTLRAPDGQPARMYAKGWADWNQNGAFESTEVIYQGDSGSAVQEFVPANPSFPVPENAVIGPTEVRFRCALSPVTDPTGTLDSGEVHDILVIVFQDNQTLTVTTEADEFDTPSGDNLSLREAIRDTLPFAYNSIGFDPSVRTLTLTRGELAVFARNLDINADPVRPVTVDGNQNGRVFSFDSGCRVLLNNLTIRNGRAPAHGAGGGILNQGSLSLESCRVDDNRSGDGMDGAFATQGGSGGGIHNSGTLNLRSCRVTGNQTGRGGNATGANASGGKPGEGGGIANQGVLNLSDCALANNATGPGGNASPGGSGVGGYGNGGGVSLSVTATFAASRCSFTDNHAVQNGRNGNGQVRNDGASGGGIYAFGPMLLENCTVAGNRSADTAYGGGGLALFHNAMVLRNCTVIGNTTTGPGGGIYCFVSANLDLENCVVAGNTTSHANAIQDLGISQNLNSLGVNFIGDSTGAVGLQPDDLVDQNPILLPLGQYGGVGLSAPPGTGSPLRNAGETTNGTPELDQRGVPRASGGILDIGAVELGEYNRAPSLPSGYENAADVTRAFDPVSPVSYEPIPSNPATPGGEEADKAIDNQSDANNGTKFLHVDGDGSGLDIALKFVPVRLAGITLTSANDEPYRDPSHFVLLGKNARGEFDLIAEGAVPAFSDRFVSQTFPFAAPAEPYSEFRLLFPNIIADLDAEMQIGEVELLGLPADTTLRFTGVERVASDQMRVSFAAPGTGGTYRFPRTTNFTNFVGGPTGVRAPGGRGAFLVNNPGSVSFKGEQE